MIDLDRLETLARDATQDGWWSGDELGAALIEFNGRVEEWDAAAFMAEVSPTVVLALTAELRQVRACIEKVRKASREADIPVPDAYELGQEDVRDDMRRILAEYDKKASDGE